LDWPSDFPNRLEPLRCPLPRASMAKDFRREEASKYQGVAGRLRARR